MPKNKLFVIMGVSGTGKTTIGNLLSEALELPFFDGDDFHPQANVDKMRSGEPLNDDDRQGWLISLNTFLKSKSDSGAIIACSALKSSYRTILKEDLGNQKLRFIFLKGSFDVIHSRMKKRANHFMPPHLLKSQFDTLEEPKEAIVVSIENSPDIIIKDILKEL